MSHDTGTFMFRCLCEKILFHISRVFFYTQKYQRIGELKMWIIVSVKYIYDIMEYIRVACITGTLILKIARHSNDSMLNI